MKFLKGGGEWHSSDFASVVLSSCVASVKVPTNKFFFHSVRKRQSSVVSTMVLEN